MDPQHRFIAEFDAYQETYKDRVNAALSFTGLELDFFTSAKAEHLIEMLARHFGDLAKLRVLDLGCGVGTYHAYLSGRVGHLYGIDVSQACVAMAKRHYPGSHFTTYEGDGLPFESGFFDAAFTICVLHHVPPRQWSSFAAEMVRVVRPGGLVVVFEHNPHNPMTRLVVNRCPFDRDAVLLSPRKLRQLFASMTVEQIALRHILTIPAKGRLLRQLDAMLGVLALGAQYHLAAVVKQSVGQDGS